MIGVAEGAGGEGRAGAGGAGAGREGGADGSLGSVTASAYVNASFCVEYNEYT
jgi:hypothetical protein